MYEDCPCIGMVPDIKFKDYSWHWNKSFGMVFELCLKPEEGVIDD